MSAVRKRRRRKVIFFSSEGYVHILFLADLCTVSISSVEKKRLAEACLEFVIRDLRPLSSVESAGLKALVNCSLEIGFERGKISQP